MTWGNRFRLLIGLVAVFAIVLVSTLVLSVRQTEVGSSSASVKAVTYSIGSDYAGTVVGLNVKEGDKVTKGEPLVTIQSAAVAAASAVKGGIPTNASFTVARSGMLTLNATEAGVIEKLGVQVGGFVSAGSSLATIDRAQSLYVQAKFRLDPYDFSRVQKGARVDLVLPDQSQLTGTVTQIRVTTTGSGAASAEVQVTSPQLTLGGNNGLGVPGTPVQATLRLRDDGPLGGLRVMFAAWLQKLHL